MTSRRGMSLVETLMFMALVLLLMGCAGVLLQGYLRAGRETQNQPSVFDTMGQSSQQMVDEARQATAALQPVSNGQGPELVLERYLPSAVWLPRPLPLPNATTWEPREATRLMRVRYALDGENRLARAVTPGNTSLPATQEVVSDVLAGLEFSRDPAGGLHIRLSLREARRVVVLERFVGTFCP